MNNAETNKQILRDFIQNVWVEQELTALPDFWTDDCVNHAAPGPENQGLESLRGYHEHFFTAFSAFSEIRMEIVQQIAEADRVVTYIVMHAKHTGPFFGIPATGKNVSTSAMRIDRIQDGKIAEHWSVSDAASLATQLQA